MSFFSNDDATAVSCTSIVHRAAGGIADVRQVFDDACRLAVIAFPAARIRAIVASKAAVPACYILADHSQIYIGETNNIGRRLTEHLGDPAKLFMREVFVIAGSDGGFFDKTAAVYLQYRLTNAADEAGLVEVQKGVSPRLLELPPWRRAPLDQIVKDGMRLLFDAGCRAFHSSCASQRPAEALMVDADTVAETDGCDSDDTSRMEIGVIAPSNGLGELQLNYGGLWARGYPANNGFVVTAGSEVRSLVNASVNPILHTRRAELEAAGALADIPGLTGRKRLLVPVWFPSAAIAAKVLTGAHVASRTWAAPNFPQPMIIAA